MTEAEWLACDDPLTAMFSLYRSWNHPQHGNHRRLRLFACACCSLRSDCLRDERWRTGIEAIESHADGIKTRGEMDDICHAASVSTGVRLFASEGSSFDAAYQSLKLVVSGELEPDPSEAHVRYRVLDLLRDIFGNPFHPITLNPSWLTSTVVSIANQMYDTRDFSAMPILADALQDSSCDNETILTHCRGPGPHVRGCFVIDLLTGRE